MKRGSSVNTGVLLKGNLRVERILKTAGVSTLEPAFRTARPLSVKESTEGRVDISLIYLAHLREGQNPIEAARRLNRSGEFEYAEPKYIHHLFDSPDDPDFNDNQKDYFNQMNAMAGWAITKGDSNVVIADVDGGIFWQHPDLMQNLWINVGEDFNRSSKFEQGPPPEGDENGIDDDDNGFIDDIIGWNFPDWSNNPNGSKSMQYSNYHGTATASMVGAVTNNSLGMAGSSWNCHLMPINTSSRTSVTGIAWGYEGIYYAYANGAKIINCSWGRTGSPSKFEQDMINAATQNGALVVAAAGNDTINADYIPNYPANYRNVLAVGALISGLDERAEFSNYGFTIPVYAPGTNIWGALDDGTTGNVGDGTSFSTPLVAGLAGLLKSYYPTWTPRQIATQIRITTDSLGKMLGHGRVNFGRALQESHAGIEILNSSFVSSSGKKDIFLAGDTVALFLTVKNVMFIPANNLIFIASSLDPVMQVLQGTVGSTFIDTSESQNLQPFIFKIGTLDAPKDVVIKLTWTLNSDDYDVYAFKLRVYPTYPQWEKLQSPTYTALYSVTAVNQNIVWASGGVGNNTAPVVLRTINGGDTWKDVTGNLSGVDLYTIAAIDSDRAWVGTSDGRIFATTNGGAMWSVQTYPGIQSPFIDGIRMFSDLTGYVLGDPASGGKYVILKTLNGGNSWAHLTHEPVGDQDEAGWNNSFHWTDRFHGWFGTNNYRIWKTSDGGVTWDSGSTSSSNSYAISFSDNLNGVTGFSDGSIMKTSDGGSHWFILTSQTESPISGAVWVRGTHLVWVTDLATPFFSRNAGLYWSVQSSYLFDGSINHIAFSDTTTGWMVTSYGEILRYRSLIPTIVKPLSRLPLSYRLFQNYPNPFNPTTNFEFQIPISGLVSLKVYDILGRELADLLNEMKPAGIYKIAWNASSLSSGIYFYRLQVSSMNITKRMILIK